MRHRTLLTTAALLAGVIWSALPLTAQTPKELDVMLEGIGGTGLGFQWHASNCTENAYSFGNQMCNISRGDPGQIVIDWYASENENHPFTAFLMAGEFATAGGTRFRQISDRSWLKHFFSAQDDPCAGQPTSYPTVGTDQLFGRYCSDIYTFGHNGNRNHLAPADENDIDPWNGIWTFAGSRFDGNPPSGQHAPPAATDDFQGRIRVKNTSLSSAQKLYFQAFLILSQEQTENIQEKAEHKLNNIGSRRWEATKVGQTNEWDPSVPTTNNDIVQGSILKQWDGATVTDNESTAETDEGVYYVAVKVTGPVDGLYTYEYAVHNRDHKAGACKVQINWCPDAKLYGMAQTFDIDDDSENDWTASFPGSAEYIQFKKEGTGSTNPILWNTIRNISFVSDARPVSGEIRLYPDGGGDPITITTTVPRQIFNINMGGGCGTPAIRVFSEDVSVIGQLVTIWSINHAVEQGYCVARFQIGAELDEQSQYGCTMWLNQQQLAVNELLAVNNHRAYYQAQIPNTPALHGTSVYVQTAEQVDGGPWDGINFGNGLEIRVRDESQDPIPDCRACEEN
jgi:hypothetical protein